MKKDAIIENLRQIVFSMVQILFVGFQSVGLFLDNKPQEFGKFGAIIIVWSIINLSLSRARYSSITSQWENTLLSNQIKYQEYRAKFRDTALHNTFNLHAAYIAQICHELGRSTVFVDNDKAEIEKFVAKVNNDLGKEDEFKEKQNKMAEKLESFKSQYDKETGRLKSWSDLFMKIEVFLLSWGTLQNAYGADFVTWFHS